MVLVGLAFVAMTVVDVADAGSSYLLVFPWAAVLARWLSTCLLIMRVWVQILQVPGLFLLLLSPALHLSILLDRVVECPKLGPSRRCISLKMM